MNITINHEKAMSPPTLYYKEKEYLHQLPSDDINDAYLTTNKYNVSLEGLIRYENSRCSVYQELIGEEVTFDVFNDKLHIYYTWKPVTCNTISGNPINYRKEHYESLMSGKAKEYDIETIAENSLEMMDKLLESRTVNVTEVSASKSKEVLIAYLNQNECGKWIINIFPHLSSADKLIFIKGMNEILPHVSNRDKFISNIKFSMKTLCCKHLAVDCLVSDLMVQSEHDCILTDASYEVLMKKYENEVDVILKDIVNQFANEKKY